MSSLTFQILGALRARIDQQEIDLGPPKQKAVLAVLLLNANEMVAMDRIIDSVWGEDPPRTAEHSVQIYVSELRKALANGGSPEMIETRPPGYVLNVNPELVDATKFERLVRDGLTAVRTGDVAGGRPKLENALDGWAGPPLVDFAYKDFAQGHIRSLQELRSDVLETLAGACLDVGDLDRSRELARQASEANPLREEPRRLTMLAMCRSGRQAEALRHYGEYQALLAEELGIEPSEGLRDLEERILLQDPTLNLKRAVSAEGNPYRGLRAFSEDDSEVYFGRERLVAEVFDKLAGGSGFVSIVGPSGSGKSSAARAGVIPGLRAQGETVVVMQPGAAPLWELAGALDRAGFGSRATLLRRFENDARSLVGTINRSVVLIVDQFEELFTLAEPDAAVRLSELIAAAIKDVATPLRVVATLRADYYDKPLSMPALAGVFSDSVVSVKPMTPVELERAVVEPARAAGVSVEPALLAQLVADMGDEPGALPLLQFTLFELYERTSNGLTQADYEHLGGLHGALTGGADQLMEELDEEGRDLVEQLMMRMIQKGRALSTAWPVALRDLLDLGVDRVALQGVLEAFGSRRLITFDRDASGSAVVEMAHEYLISEWPRMASWIDVHSDDLDRLHALDAATDEWVAADRSEDYLLRGERLDRFESWEKGTTLRLTRTEVDFIGASLDLRKREEAPPDVVIAFHGRGDEPWGDLIKAGLDRAAANFDLEVAEHSVDAHGYGVVGEAIDAGAPLAILEAIDADRPLGREFLANHPDTPFVIIDSAAGMAPFPVNATCISTRNVELGYLAGVLSALASETGTVGFIGGVDIPVIHEFQAGFEQGVEVTDPSTVVETGYLSGWNGLDFDFSGFASYTLAELLAEIQISRGADVIFPAAGVSAWGAFRAAGRNAQTGAPVWVIGVDIDMYDSFAKYLDDWDLDPEVGAIDQSRILTSIIKRVDIGVYLAIEQFVTNGQVDPIELTLANGGVGYTTTGGSLDPWIDELDAAIEAVKDGSVVLNLDRDIKAVLLADVLAESVDQ